MKKPSKKQRIKALENEVLTLRALVNDFMGFVGYEGQDREPVKLLQIEPYSVFEAQLRATEAKYALKVS